jgi:F0F1-type ATP synthase assembly protein I
MLECPSCHQNVAHHGQGKWFECPNCRNWICLKVNQNGVGYFELGVMGPNGVIQPVRPIQNQGQTTRSAGANRAAFSFPDVRTMDLSAVRTEEEKVKNRLDELGASISGIRDQNRQVRLDERFRQHNNTLLATFNQEQKRLTEYRQRLADRETEILQKESETTRQTSSPSNGWGCTSVVFINTIIVGVCIYFFTRFSGFHLDLRAFLYLGLAALISSLISTIVAQMV